MSQTICCLDVLMSCLWALGPVCFSAHASEDKAAKAACQERLMGELAQAGKI